MKIKALISITIIMIFFGLASTTIFNISSAAASNAADNSKVTLEQQILSATVRIMVESWVVRADETGYDIDYTMGHGTVMDGRYLVTHNHFDVPLSILHRQGDEGSYAVVYFYNSRGEPLRKSPLTDFELVHRDVETLVFAHKEEGYFEKLGITSAPFAAWSSLNWEPGMEVAQVDWDGNTARVDWVNIKDIVLDDGAPRIVLDDGVLPGASGGGIFYKGVHIANNWQLHETIDMTGSVAEATTVAALNSAAIVSSP